MGRPPPGDIAFAAFEPPFATIRRRRTGWSAVSTHEDLYRKARRDRARVVPRGRRGADPRTSRDAHRGHAAREAQAAVHTPRRHGRLRRRRERRENRGHGLEARLEALL